jgi:glyoxylase-like metal-dependent hydrolase (beta-lactamase superfamily II)
MYQLDVLIQGFPGRSVCHGSLGWSTLTLLRGQGRTLLVDVGSFGIRHMLQQQLHFRGVAADDVTDVLLTHAHYDHAVNFTLFPQARIWIGDQELSWAAAQPVGFNPLPELYVRELMQSPRVHRIQPGEAFLPGIQAVAAPGHTPGHLLFYLTGTPVPVLFSGDAAKNRAELLSGDVDATEDRAQSHATLETLWQLWRAQPGTLLVPGHDLCMVLDDAGHIQYQGQRQAGIDAWFSESLSRTTHFDLRS